MITSIYDVKACPECAGSNLSYLNERDQVVCRECGLVYEPLTPKDERRLERVSRFMKTTPRTTSPKKTPTSPSSKPARPTSAKKQPPRKAKKAPAFSKKKKR